MTVPEHAIDTDPHQEHDVWWGCYAGRSFAPSFFLCGLLSLIVITIFVNLWSDEKADQFVTWHLTLAALLLIWLVQFVRWLYYLAWRSYRLTNRGLYRDVGFSRVRSQSIALKQIHLVLVRMRPHERRLGIGRIEIYTDDSSRPIMILRGLREPEDVARLIRRWIGLAKDIEVPHGTP